MTSSISEGPTTNLAEMSPAFPFGSTLLLVWVFLMTFLGRTILSPLLLVVEQELGMSHAEGGSLFMVISVGLIGSTVFSGFLLLKIQHHMAITLAGVLVGVGFLILAVSRAVLPFGVGLLVIGGGAGLYLPSAMTTLTDIVPNRLWGRAIAFHELGPILGLAAAPFLAEISLRYANWRVLLVFLGFVAFLAAVGFWRYAGGGRFHGTPPAWGAVGGLLKRREFWAIGFLFVMATGLEMGVYSMLPAYLVDGRGLSRSFVNTVVSTSRLTAVVMVFVSGWATDRFGRRRVLAGIAVTSGLATMGLGLAEGGVLMAAVYLQPMLVSGFFPPGFAVLSGVTSARQRNLAISLVVPMGYLFGAGAVPIILGYLAEIGSFGLGFVWVGAVMVGAAVLVPLLNKGV